MGEATPTFGWRHVRRRLWRLVLRAAWFFVVFSVGLVVVYKFVPPLYTPLMLTRKVQALASGQDPRIYYDWTPYQRISPEAALAVVASEDQTFPDHGGFDFSQLQKVLQQQGRRKRTRGASTITQQVAKNMFLWNGRSYLRKGLEAYFAGLIELIWGKQRILEVYLNVAETGERTFGVPAAARRFFDRPPDRLTRQQAAILAAVLPNPVRFSAQKPSGYVKARAGFIAGQMRQLGGAPYLADLRRF